MTSALSVMKFLRDPRMIARTAVAAGIILWIGGAAAGLGILASYSMAASPAGAAPESWPAQARLARAQGAWQLLVFLHPRCPCSAATLGELNRMLAHAPDLRVIMAFNAPAGWSAEENLTALRRRAEGMRSPRVEIVDDPDGASAVLFGAQSSGHTVLYDPEGRRRFYGGITAARGHEGSNPGAEAIVQLLLGQAPGTTHTPTFGCELYETELSGCCDEEEAE